MFVRIIFFYLYLRSIVDAAGEIVGCNGFVKSDYPIDFSQIEVKLYTPEGNLKDRAECAPNNGYYFMPIYDKGEYSLQVSSSDNWIFEPNSFRINFDGTTDDCSRNVDINFAFKGFRVSGAVGTITSENGPKGVLVTLLADLMTEQKEIKTVQTEADGKFEFFPLVPGSYILKASHPRWKISKSLTTLQITDRNHQVPKNSLLLAGYDVSGYVITGDQPEPVKDVMFFLFGSLDPKVEEIWLSSCNSSVLEGTNTNFDGKQSCYVTSNEKGYFEFAYVPSGSYTIFPVYKTLNSVKFDVHPSSIKFLVNNDSYKFDRPFQVIGFSITGRVMTKKDNGKPIVGVKVIVNDVKQTKTLKDGTFMIDGMKAGIYKIQFIAANLSFSSKSVKISPNMASLDDIYPDKFEVCGRVKYINNVLEYPITFEGSSKGDRYNVIPNKKSGHYCIFLPPGTYKASVNVPSHSLKHPIWFSPSERLIRVVDGLVKHVSFEQLNAKVTGRVICPNEVSCSGIQVKLISQTEDGLILNTLTKDGSYIFPNLTSGFYEISVEHVSDWCWEETFFLVDLLDIHTVAPVFKSTGFAIVANSSHQTQIKYKKVMEKLTLIEQVFNVRVGIQRLCIPSKIGYTFEAMGCHKYNELSVEMIGSDLVLQLVPISHEITGTIISSESVNDLHVKIYEADTNNLKERIGPLSHTSGPQYVYKYKFQASDNIELILIPESATMLFSPSELKVGPVVDCMEFKDVVIAKKGICFNGLIEPPLKDVTVSILKEDGNVVLSTLTDEDGKYSFTPLDSEGEYSVIGNKEGYVVKGPFENGLFKAFKLAEIIVNVEDVDSNPLQETLLLLSGGENYRKNLKSNDNGIVKFDSLNPGEYYLRPMLKEYKFDPTSSIVSVIEGQISQVKFNGTRILYSAYGSIVAINHFPEVGLIVEAIGKEEESKCKQLHEETTTLDDGSFRVRGLHPYCEYDIHVKKNSMIQQKINYTMPTSLKIKVEKEDIHDLIMFTIPQATMCDVSVLVSINVPEYVSTLQIKLIDENSKIISIAKTKDWKNYPYDTSLVLVPFYALPLDGRKYYVELDSTLPKSSFDYVPTTTPFQTNTTFQLIRMSLAVNVKHSDSEIKHSYTVVIFILITIGSYWYHKEIIAALSATSFRDIFIKYLSRPQKIDNKQQNIDPFIEFEPALTVVKRKVKPRKT